MGFDQPFMYDNPTKYSFVGPGDRGFHPKAATQASWRPREPRPKHNGPLIESKEFNRHPDSYSVAPYGNLNTKPMSKRTKSKVKWTRLVQLGLRICALLGALGMLVCVICIKGTEGATGWIIRVPPAVAILHTVYGIYHLARASKGRTPASSASYMIFAATLDAGLIPFFVFTALVARPQYMEPGDIPGQWKTLFGNELLTTKIMYATFLLSVINGGIHLASLIISIYLGTIFRNIARLPPDMNPLEDNLTSRHKHKRSDMSQATTVVASKRGSKVDEPLISPVRNVPFMHTRNISHADINNIPSPSFSPRASNMDVSERPISGTASRRTSRTHFPNLCQHVHPQDPPKQIEITRSPTKTSSIYSVGSEKSRPRSTAPSLPDSNWITYSAPSPSPSPSPPRGQSLRNKAKYQPLFQKSAFEYTDENAPPLPPQPLQMNPPTPPIDESKAQMAYKKCDIEGRALTPTTGNWGPGLIGIGKARQWGNGSRNTGPDRVVSRSGIEISQGGILPSGGVRAREVSGKVMEEGRGSGGGWR